MTINRRIDRMVRLMDGLPALPRNILVVLAAVCFAALARLTTDRLTEGVAPFVFNFPAVLGATLLAGRLAGVSTIAICQLPAWNFVIRPQTSESTVVGGLVSLALATLSQLLIVWAVSEYRDAARAGQAAANNRAEVLALALCEIDHRTKNNFQIAGSLLVSQAAAAGGARIAEQLRIAANRLMTIAGTYDNLALSSSDIGSVRLDRHLDELCDRLRSGLLPPAVRLHVSASPVTVDARTAAHVGLVANEWITNAAKYAFPEQIGSITLALIDEGDRCLLRVVDAGVGGDGAMQAGTGTRLLDLLARGIGGDMKIEAGQGRICSLRFPKRESDRER